VNEKREEILVEFKEFILKGASYLLRCIQEITEHIDNTNKKAKSKTTSPFLERVIEDKFKMMK